MASILSIQDFKTKESEAIEEFLQDKLKKSENTYIAYKSDIAHFFKSIFNKQIQHISKSDLENINLNKLKTYLNNLYIDALNGKINCSNKTINRKQAAIKSMIKYLKGINIISNDISYLELIESLPDDSEEIRYMPKHLALKYADFFLKHEAHKPLEKHLLVMLALDTGLRLSELLDLRWNQFVVDGAHVTIHGRGKGNKKWIDKINYELMYKKLLPLKTNEKDKLFSLSRKNVHDMMQRAKKHFGHEDINYSFHSFKKTAVTFAYRATGSLEQAQKKGRHASLETTKIYLEEEELLVTGVISLGETINPLEYRNATHEELIKALDDIPDDLLFRLNMLLSRNKELNK